MDGGKRVLQLSIKPCKHSAAAVRVHQTEKLTIRGVFLHPFTMTGCGERCSVTLMQHTHQRTCASCSVWSDPHWHLCLDTLSLLPVCVAVLSSPTWAATTATVWRPSVEETTDPSLRFLPDAERRRNVPPLELHRPSVTPSVCVLCLCALQLTLSSSDY